MEKIKQAYWLLTSTIIPSCGVGITFYFVLKNQWNAVLISAFITLLVATLIFLLWWKLNNKFEVDYYQSLIANYSSYQSLDLKTTEAFTPDLEKVFIPLQVVSKSPKQISSAIIQTPESSESLNIWDFLAVSKREPAYRRIILIGAIGTGKTKLLEYLTLTYAKNTQKQKHSKAPKLIPVLLPLSQISQVIISPRLPNLAVVITKLLQHRDSFLKTEPPQQWFQEKLREGKCLVMLDGLDEVTNPEERKTLIQWLNMQLKTYSESLFIITSRPNIYRNNHLQEIRLCLELQLLNKSQIEEFLHLWYIQNEILSQASKDLINMEEKAKMKATKLLNIINQSPSLAAIAGNPLLLSIIINFHEHRSILPKYRAKLYEEILEVLLKQRQKIKGFPELIKLKYDQKQFLLQMLALELMCLKQTEFTINFAKEIITKSLKGFVGEEINVKEFLKYVEIINGLLVEIEPGVYRFPHISFQQYLAAVQIKQTNQEAILIENIEQTWWNETIRLYGGINQCNNIILAAWNKQTIESINLAYDCLEEGKNVDPQLREKLENWLETALESNNPTMANLAAQVQLSRRLKYAMASD